MFTAIFSSFPVTTFACNYIIMLYFMSCDIWLLRSLNSCLFIPFCTESSINHDLGSSVNFKTSKIFSPLWVSKNCCLFPESEQKTESVQASTVNNLSFNPNLVKLSIAFLNPKSEQHLISFYSNAAVSWE